MRILLTRVPYFGSPLRVYLSYGGPQEPKYSGFYIREGVR